MWVVRQADDPFVYFGAKPNKGLGLDISDETGSGGGKAVGEERRREVVDNGQQKKAMRKTVEGELAFLVAFVGISQKIHSQR